MTLQFLREKRKVRLHKHTSCWQFVDISWCYSQIHLPIYVSAKISGYTVILIIAGHITAVNYYSCC